MKNRITGIFVIFSIIIVFLYLLPIEREIKIKVDKSLQEDLIQMDIIISDSNHIISEKKYYLREKFFKYYDTLDDKIRLKRGVYKVDAYLVYKDKYIYKRSILPINIINSGDAVIQIKE